MEARSWHKHYDATVPPELELEPLSLPEFLRASVERGPERTAILFQNKRLSYLEFDREVQRCAAGLASLGVGPDTSLAIQLPNLPQAPIAYYAALQLGARVVLTNPLYTPREMQHQWSDAECEVVITMDFLWDQKVRALRPKLAVKHFIIASIPEYLGFPLNFLAPFKLRRAQPPMIAKFEREAGVQGFKELLKSSSARAPRPELDLDAIAVLQYTGGTTGVSKAAMLTHRNLSANTQQTRAWFSTLRDGQEVILTAVPLFHVFGMTVCMNLAVIGNSAMLLVPNPRDTPGLLACIDKFKPTIFPGVPALYNNLNQLAARSNADLSSLRICISGSAPIAGEVQETFERLSGSVIIEGYGLSETSPLTHANPIQGERRLGKIGLPVSSTDARIVDADDPSIELPPGEEGELLLRGPQVMAGYWKRPDETQKCMHGEWFMTGDLACLDTDGYFSIVGRKKDMINISGMKVYPDEIDALLMENPKILEAATIGAPHHKYGEIVKSFVVLQPGAQMDAEEVIEFCRGGLAPYKVPRAIEFIDELPKSNVLKVLRRVLRERELASQQASQEET